VPPVHRGRCSNDGAATARWQCTAVVRSHGILRSHLDAVRGILADADAVPYDHTTIDDSLKRMNGFHSRMGARLRPAYSLALLGSRTDVVVTAETHVTVALQ
jgi:hypothetical protein